MYYLLTYDVVPDYLTKREQYRAKHIQLAKASTERGELCLGGALSTPSDSAVLLFKSSSEKVVEDFAINDPYVINGLVRKWTVREWNIVIGAGVEGIQST